MRLVVDAFQMYLVFDAFQVYHWCSTHFKYVNLVVEAFQMHLVVVDAFQLRLVVVADAFQVRLVYNSRRISSALIWWSAHFKCVWCSNDAFE